MIAERPIKAPVVKTLQRQIQERTARASNERHLYKLWMEPVTWQDREGRTHVEVVTKVRRKEVGLGEMPVPVYSVTRHGCNCPDKLRARAAGIDRCCKHEVLEQIWLADQEFDPYALPDSDLSTVEEKSADVLALTAGGRDRAAFLAQMEADFPA